jgi:Ca-activated chloride channel family protein
MNTGGHLREKLHLIYPKEGIVTADYPLMLLNRDKREIFNKLVEYLKGESAQQWVMAHTKRRPVTPRVRLSGEFSDQLMIELPFPADKSTIDTLLFSFLDEVRAPSSPFFVLDVSGSMNQENRLQDLRTALNNLTGLDTSLTGRFARFRAREDVRLLPFNAQPFPITTVTVESKGPQGPAMQQIRSFVTSLQADGGTAIYDALMEAYRVAGEEQKKDPERYYSIVLLSDGKNEHGKSLRDFEHFYRMLPPEVKKIKTFAIIFGNANIDEMNKVAELTGGRVFDGKQHNLAHVFKKIRGYQ